MSHHLKISFYSNICALIVSLILPTHLTAQDALGLNSDETQENRQERREQRQDKLKERRGSQGRGQGIGQRRGGRAR